MIINAIIQVYHHHKIIVTIQTEISHIVRLKTWSYLVREYFYD